MKKTLDLSSWRTALGNLLPSAHGHQGGSRKAAIGSMLIMAMLFAACGDDDATSSSSVTADETGSMTDSRDGKTYRTVKIGDQVWMAENLNYETVNSRCYDDDPANCAKYGRLYTWAAAVGKDVAACGYGYECGLGSGDIRGACPKGWHLPSKAEWEALIVAVDGSITEYTSSKTVGTKLKSVTGWSSNGNGTNAFGFSALPAGYRGGNGNYYREGNGARFWSSTEGSSDVAYGMDLYYNYDLARLGNLSKLYGNSVRCLKD